MSEHHDGLHLIPEHMREAVVKWIEHAEPHPDEMGGFLRAVLSNDLMGAFARADEYNAAAMRNWCLFMYNHMPAPSHGSPINLRRWYERHHPNAADPDRSGEVYLDPSEDV